VIFPFSCIIGIALKQYFVKDFVNLEQSCKPLSGENKINSAIFFEEWDVSNLNLNLR
jgi:hypothetical protein